MFTDKQQCIYLPNGTICEITKLYPDRHRARIKVVETGREIDEVAWHDLAVAAVAVVPKAKEPVPEPTPAPPPEQVSEPRAASVSDPFRRSRFGRGGAGEGEDAP